MNTIYDGFIFDVDGTIWDSTPVVEKAWNAALRDSGHGDVSITADRLKGLFGLPMLDIIEDILPGSTLEEREAFLPLCSGYEFEYLERESGVVYEGLEETLRTLSSSGIPLFIVSNCQSGYIELMYRKTGFGKYHVRLFQYNGVIIDYHYTFIHLRSSILKIPNAALHPVDPFIILKEFIYG